MITEAESGFSTSVYNAINAGGHSYELRLTAYPAEWFPPNYTDIAFSTAIEVPRRIEQVDSTRYVINTGALEVRTTSGSTTWYANSVIDFYFDGTHVYVFRNVSGTIYRYKHTPSSGTAIETLNVGTFTYVRIAVGDENNLFYWKDTNRNMNLCKRTYSGGTWTETTSDIWFYNANSDFNRLFAIEKDNGEFLLVMRVLLPGEKYPVVSGTTTTWFVERHALMLSYIWGDVNCNIIHEEVKKGTALEESKYITNLMRYDDYYVAIIAGAKAPIAGSQIKPIYFTISKDGVYWSELFAMDSAFENSSELSSYIIYVQDYPGGPTGMATAYTMENTVCFGKALDGAPLYYNATTPSTPSAVIHKVPKSARLFGFDDCDAGTVLNVTKDQWQFEQSGVMQVNFECANDPGYSLIRHELGTFIEEEMRWFQYAVTFVDTVDESFEPATGKTTYSVSTRDAMAWMIDKFQSAEAREWNGHQVAIEDFGGKQSKMAVVAGKLEYLTTPNQHGLLTPSLTPGNMQNRAFAAFTGMEDKRNHCQTYYCEPTDVNTQMRLFPIAHPEFAALHGCWLNVTTTNLIFMQFHNGVSASTSATTNVTGAKYFRIQLHYGLVRIYYSTNNTTWTKLDYPLVYTGMELLEHNERPITSSPWPVSYPHIGLFSATGSTAKFYSAINTNRDKPILLTDAVEIAGAFSGIFGSKFDHAESVMGGGAYMVGGGDGGVWINGTRTGTHTAGFGYDILSSLNTYEASSKVALRWGALSAIQISANAPQTKLGIFIHAIYVRDTTRVNFVASFWNGNEIVTGYYQTNITGDEKFYQAYTTWLEYIYPQNAPHINILTIDPGESPQQGLSRAFEGREHLGYFLRSTGELWMRPTAKTGHTPDTNLITYWTRRNYQDNYADNIILRRKITAFGENMVHSDYGIEGTFDVQQNTMIDNPIEPVHIVIMGEGRPVSYQCEIPLFQELYDAIVDGYRIKSISGRLVNGKLEGSISIGNEEIL